MAKEEQTFSLSEHLMVKKDNGLKIVFQSALDQWTFPLKMLFGLQDADNENIKIANWDMSMNSIENVIKRDSTDYRHKTLQDKISGYPTSDILHVFVAPITWAAKHRSDGKFKIIGPAFGSNSDISIYAKKNLKSRTDGIIKIGMVDDDITSNVMFQLYHLLLTEQFKTDIYQIIDTHINGSPTGERFKIDGYEYEPAINPCDRLGHLLLDIDDDDAFDFAIFTNKDISIIEEKASEEKNLIRKVMEIDPIISHFFNQDYTPRSVYCVHETQYNQHREEIKSLFDSINKVTTKPQNFEGIFALDPYDATDKNIQSNLIRISKNKGILHIPHLRFT